MIRVNIKVNMKKSLVLLLFVLLVGCSANRSQVGAVMGATTTTSSCVAMGVNDPYVIGVCSLTGAFAGASIMYNSDYDIHYAQFVDHLNSSPGNKQSYTTWYNSKTKNSGIIKTNSSYLRGPIKCKDYSSTIDITQSWPLIGIGGVNRKMLFGTVCQMPDGQWKELKNG